MSTANPDDTTRDRTVAIHQAFWLEHLTLARMTVEAAVATVSGIAANSLTLVAFGIDSVIELASAGILVWRLTVELRRGKMFAEGAEQKAPCRLRCRKRWLEALDTPRRGVLAAWPHSVRARCSDNVFPFPP